MSRVGCYLMGFGFAAAWLLPVAGVVVMVVGAVVTAIASERAMLPEFLAAAETPEPPGIGHSTDALPVPRVV